MISSLEDCSRTIYTKQKIVLKRRGQKHSILDSHPKRATMSFYMTQMFVIPKWSHHLRQLSVLRYEIIGEQRVIFLWVCQKTDSQSILLGIKPVAHKLRIVKRQINIMNMHYNSCFKPGKDFKKEDHAIGIG